MTPNELQSLEKLQIGDIKSAMDQIKYLIIENNAVKTKLSDLYAELDKKVNLESNYLTEQVPVTVIGSGVVSATGSNIVGTETLFTTEIHPGDSIKIGIETQVVETIVSDTALTTVDPFTNSTNQVYAITKLINPEVLIGNFEFGITNGKIFNGIVKQNSVFQSFGRMTDPNDIINVQYAQRLATPAMIRANNSILRTGDTVGDPTSTITPVDTRYIYNMTNLVWNFDSQCNAYYGGVIDEANTDLGRSSFINRGYLLDTLSDNSTAYKNDFFTAHWASESHAGIPIVGVGGYNIFNIAGTPPNNKTGSINLYFSSSSSGLNCVKECTILVSINGYMDMTRTDDGHGGLIAQIALGSNVVSKMLNYETHSNAHGSAAVIGSSCLAIVHCMPGDIIAAGLGQMSDLNTIHSYLSITMLR
jgi:hypothetical protein